MIIRLIIQRAKSKIVLALWKPHFQSISPEFGQIEKKDGPLVSLYPRRPSQTPGRVLLALWFITLKMRVKKPDQRAKTPPTLRTVAFRFFGPLVAFLTVLIPITPITQVVTPITIIERNQQ